MSKGVAVPLIVAVALALVSIIADIFMKYAGNGSKFIDTRLFIIGTAIYLTTVFGWFYVFKYLKVTTIGVFYGVSSLVFLVLVGIFYFKESVNQYEIIGIILALISMILLARFA